MSKVNPLFQKRQGGKSTCIQDLYSDSSRYGSSFVRIDEKGMRGIDLLTLPLSEEDINKIKKAEDASLRGITLKYFWMDDLTGGKQS